VNKYNVPESISNKTTAWNLFLLYMGAAIGDGDHNLLLSSVILKHQDLRGGVASCGDFSHAMNPQEVKVYIEECYPEIANIPWRGLFQKIDNVDFHNQRGRRYGWMSQRRSLALDSGFVPGTRRYESMLKKWFTRKCGRRVKRTYIVKRPD
jgi:hypothetical protein